MKDAQRTALGTRPSRRAIEPSVLRALVARVATRSLAYRYYHWDWGESIGMEGLWTAAELTRTRRYQAFVERMIRGWLAHSPTPWYPDHVGPARMLIEVWRKTRAPRVLAYAKGLAAHLDSLPRARCGAFLLRPDLPDRANMVWVDSVQTDAPFLCTLASATGDRGWFDRAAEHLWGHIRALQDPAKHLFHHVYDAETNGRNGVFWGRGNGWAMLGLVECLQQLPRRHPRRPAISASLRRLATAVLAAQDVGTSLWHTVLDRPETRLENSASLMLSCGLLRAGRAGLLAKRFEEGGLRAWRALWDAVEPDGVVKNVSARTPPRSDWKAYDRRPAGGLWPWGQGAYLLAAAAFLGAQ